MTQTQNEILLDSYLEFLNYTKDNSILTEVEIQQLVESITLDKLKNFSKEKMKIIEKALRGVKVNINGLKQSAKRYSKKLEKDFKNGMTSEEASKRLVKDVTVVITKELKSIKEKAGDEWSLGDKISVAIVFLLIAYYMHTLLSGVMFMILSNPELADLVVCVIIGPMIEEALKSYFIQMGMPWVGTGVVFGLEFVSKTFHLFLRGVKGIKKFVILRLTKVLMHFATTYIQKKIIESGEAAEKDRKFIAWIVGVGIGASWNIAMIIYNKEIIGWLKK